MTVRMKERELPEAAIATVDLAERIESVKAGLLGAGTGGVVFGAIALVNEWWLVPRLTPLTLTIPTHTWTALISGAIAALSGFLFGVTYRYIIRQDQNPHLRSGAVLAFGLVRALALVEGRLQESPALLPLLILGGESLILFAGVRLVLDQALAAKWIKPFGSLSATNTAPTSVLQSNSYSVKTSNSG
ncbi:MAG: hypothetical protein ACAF41_20680 [Leptolyngbya sp. BL-A-14]